MASLSQEAPKKWRVQWIDVAGTGRRKQIRMSGLTRKQAESQFAGIESIISTRLQGAKLDDVDAAIQPRLEQGLCGVEAAGTGPDDGNTDRHRYSRSVAVRPFFERRYTAIPKK